MGKRKKITKEERCIERIKKRHLVDADGNTTTEDYEVLVEAVEALKKQVPKKVEYIYTDNLDITSKIPACPVCRNYYIDNEDEYCEKCGQKIDWSDEE